MFVLPPLTYLEYFLGSHDRRRADGVREPSEYFQRGKKPLVKFDACVSGYFEHAQLAFMGVSG